MNFRKSFVASPVRWFGVALPYDPSGQLYAAFRMSVAPKAWDPTNKVWWLPETVLPSVQNLYVQYGFAAGVPALPEARVVPARANFFADLCLTPAAPPELVELAQKWWEKNRGNL